MNFWKMNQQNLLTKNIKEKYWEERIYVEIDKMWYNDRKVQDFKVNGIFNSCEISSSGKVLFLGTILGSSEKEKKK